MQTQTSRIQQDLETLATYTSTPGQGVTRSSYSKEDTMAKEYLIGEMEKLHLHIKYWLRQKEQRIGRNVSLFRKKQRNKC